MIGITVFGQHGGMWQSWGSAGSGFKYCFSFLPSLTLGKLFSLYKPQFPLLLYAGNIVYHLLQLLVICLKSLAYTRCSINRI
jgi:hypothetical protein